MKAMYECNGVTREIECSDFYADISKELVKEELTDTKIVHITVPGKGCVTYQIRPRSGTMFITEVENTLPEELLLTNMKKRFLTCVDPEKNAYKFYELTPDIPDNSVTARYGRMGTQKGELFGERSYEYPLSMFWIKYSEKLGKGYVDRSDVYLNNPLQRVEESPQTLCPDTPSAKLYALLKSFARHAVREAKVNIPITEAIIRESNKLLDKMRSADSVDAFNKYLLELIAILQRPVETGRGSGVKKIMASDPSDFTRIILREQDLITAMEGSVGIDSSNNAVESFERYNVEVYEATEKQKAQVLSRLSDPLKAKVKAVYRVIPREQQKRFDDYLKRNNIKTVKQLWHGSRNQNWMSIILNSLKLNPDAVITGKMFGHGVYFAPSSMKSWNYTSYRGTSWAKGTSETAFMGLYAVAYGNPYDTSTWSGTTDYKALVKSNHADCLHAHAGSALLNDEIVFYDEDAMVLNYIVEFK